MRNEMKAKFSSCFLLLAVGFLLLLSPIIGRAQDNSTLCKSGFESRWGWKYVWKYKANLSTGKMDYVYVYDYVYDCFPIEVQSNSGNSSGRNSSHPNTVRNSDGTLRAADGYQWVNPEDPKDFRVKPKPGLIESESGKLRPADGYEWVSNDPKDFRVKPKLGLVESEPGVLRPAKGFRWVNRNNSKDFRVERIP